MIRSRPLRRRGVAVVDFAHWPYPRRIAHRGAGKLAPENTLAAFRVGAELGYRMFEFDVKRAADGTLYLLHDATLNRTTAARGPVRRRDWAELSLLDAGSWHGPAYAGEPIAALMAVERYLRRNGFLADIEIKPVPGDDAATGAAVAEHCARSWARDAVPPLLTSFSEAALAAAREAAPAIPRGLLLDRLPRDWLSRVRSLDCVAVATNHKVLDADVVASAHAAGLRVLCYTVNDARRIAVLDRWGVDCIVTDAVDKIPFGVIGGAGGIG